MDQIVWATAAYGPCSVPNLFIFIFFLGHCFCLKLLSGQDSHRLIETVSNFVIDDKIANLIIGLSDASLTE